MSKTITVQCEYCGSNLAKSKSLVKRYKTHFCDNDCRKAYRTKDVIKKPCESCGKVMRVVPSRPQNYCSHICRARASQNRENLSCDWCGSEFERLASRNTKKAFCSINCRANYYIRQRQTIKRSFSEQFLVDLIRQKFPKLKIVENDRSTLPSGLEIDIFLPTKKLAIELNGPCHYFNIYGEANLTKVQARDAIKQAEIQQAGYPFIILDISTISDRKKLKKFIEKEFDDNIAPIIENL